MWRRAHLPAQKLAIIDGLLPITADEYKKAVIFFCGDDDESVWKKAIEKLKDFSIPDIRKNIDQSMPEKSVLALTKLAGERKAASILIALMETGKMHVEWILDYVMIQDDDLWKNLITHRDFVMFTAPRKEEFVKFFSAFSPVLYDLYIEQVGYVVKDIPAEVESGEKPDEEIKPDEQPGQEDEDVVVLGDEDFDFPDFLVSDEVFEGLNADDMMAQRKNMIETIKDMSMGQKIKLAMMGNMEVRKILIKDPRRQIAMAVLSNARITEKEVTSIASDASVSLDIIAYIASVKSLSKSYQVKLALVNNPKTPLKTSMALLDVIRINDLKNIAKSRNIPNALKMKALKKIR
ncbi:MAG TPA: hypothetical protein PK102_08305 [bacterium]|nr:hypothetical protein [bacterium]